MRSQLARTTNACGSASGDGAKSVLDLGAGSVAATNDEYGILTPDRPKHLVPPGVVDRLGHGLSAPVRGLDDEQVPHSLERRKKLGEHILEQGARRARF